MPRAIPPEVKKRARRMRREGRSLAAIATACGIAKSSASLLVRDIALTSEQRSLLDPAVRRRVGHVHWSRMCRNARRTAQLMGRAFAEIGDADYNAGVMLYWAEGAKSRNQAKIANSDAELLRVWLRWLDNWYDLPRSSPKLTVNCFLGNGLELAQIEDWWLDHLGLPRANLCKSVVNTPSRSSKGVHRKLLYGTASVAVSSTFLIQSIYGAIQEIGGFERPEWLDLEGALPEDGVRADATGGGLGG